MPDPMQTAFHVLAVLLTYPVFLLLHRVLRAVHQGWQLRHLPSPKHTLFGVMRPLMQRQDRHRLYVEWARALGPVFVVRTLFKLTVVCTDPAIIAEAIKRKELDKGVADAYVRKVSLLPHSCHDRSTATSETDSILKLPQFNSPKGHPSFAASPTNEHWKAVRKEAAVSFSTGNMRRSYPAIRLACQQLIDVVKKLGTEPVVDFDDALCRESLDVIGRVGFDRDMGATKALQGDFAADAMERTQSAMAEAEKRLRDPLRRYRLYSKDVWNGVTAIKRYAELTQGLVADLRANPPAPHTIAAHLFNVKDPATGQPLTDEYLQPEFGVMFLAGFETTGHTGAWVLYAVSQAPEVESKIVAELRELDLLATSERPVPRQIEWEDTARLRYLNCVIKEAMRIYPAGGLATLRKNVSQRDVVLGGGRLVVPPGVELHMPIAAVQMSEANWPDADRFLPERWLEDGMEDVPAAAGQDADAKRPKRFLPFSSGQRDCVGQTLAKLNLTTTLAQLYGNFSFVLADQMGGPEGVRRAEQTSLTLSCKAGMHLRVKPRAPALQ